MYERKLRREKTQREHIEYAGAGKPDIGGEFHLVDHHGNQRSDKDFLGRWLLVYFGYTFCPDICPEELEKMGNVLNKLGELFESTEVLVHCLICLLFINVHKPVAT